MCIRDRCYGALALALLPPLVQMLFLGQTAQWGAVSYTHLDVYKRQEQDKAADIRTVGEAVAYLESLK